MPGCKKPAKRSKSNWNEANIESALNICSEGKSIRATANPVECQKQHFEIDLKCKKRERYWWDLEVKLQFDNKR